MSVFQKAIDVLVFLAVPAAAYGGVCLAVTNGKTLPSSEVVQAYEPRRDIAKEDPVYRAIDYVFDPIMRAGFYPAHLLGAPSVWEYKDALAKAAEAEGFSLDGVDPRRHKFYRKLGFAVREGDKEGIYIPFDSLAPYIGSNKTGRKVRQPDEELRGLAYFKADTSGDGVVDAAEWRQALAGMPRDALLPKDIPREVLEAYLHD